MKSKNLVRTFTHYELYFTSPTEFNDPFDCNPPFSITDFTEKDLLDHFRKAFQVICPELSHTERERIIEKTVTSILKNGTFKSVIAERFLKTCLEENSKLGILCLSEVPDDILMWSHYADGHRGIVLQFDKSAIENKNNFNYCERVDYDNNILMLRDINRAKPDEHAKLLLLKKAYRWKCEKEWRIIVDPGLNGIPNSRIYIYPKEALTGVILGCQMSPEDKYSVQMWLKEGNHQARIYEAIREIGSYSLKIDPPLGF